MSQWDVEVGMGRKSPFIIYAIIILFPVEFLSAGNSEAELFLAGQDLRLAGREVISYSFDIAQDRQLSAEGRLEHIFVFPKGFSFVFADNEYYSDNAVVWLTSIATKLDDGALAVYEVRMYLHGNIPVLPALSTTEGSEVEGLPEGAKGAPPAFLRKQEGRAMVVRFGFSGEVFVTAEKREAADPRGSELYAKAFAAVGSAFPQLKPKPEPTHLQVWPESLEVEESAAVIPQGKQPHFIYPINLSPAGEVTPQMTWDLKAKMATVIGRFYLWQKQDEKGRLLELQADNAVIFLASTHEINNSGIRAKSQSDISRAEQPYEKSTGTESLEDILASGTVQAIYLAGDVVMTEGQRSIRADEIYYDLRRKQALAINAVARTFDTSRGIPIYVRAAKLKQLAENKFTAEDITLTTSEFHLPQLSLNASQVSITDTTPIDEQEDKLTDSSFDAEMRDVRFKMYDKTIFYWPHMRSNLQRPDVPLKSVSSGHNRTWGASVETQWYLARMLGLHESEGTDSTFSLDYYSKRGVGSGAEINYERENYFGRMLGYIIDDSGKDRLGRARSRRDLEPPRNLRGRFRWQHRQFLPYNWQLTAEASYISDENFIEQFYRNEFYTDKEQETLLQLKRIENNWGLAFLGKARLNDYQNVVEELPSAEFHWTGQSFLDDKLTFYSDTQFSQFRQRLGSSDSTTALTNNFAFMSTRNELDLPMVFGKSKVVPFMAGTFGYDDGSGFRTNINGTAANREDSVWFGEAGVRASTQPYWKIYPAFKSRLWDLKGLRHTITPQLTAVAFTQDDSVIEQRDTLNIGLSQRLQTKRGSGDKERTIDWMRLDTDVTWVNDSGDTTAGPDRFIWNKPFIPLANRYSRRFNQAVIPPLDRRSSVEFGPRRNYFSADYMWNLSDTTALLSDMNFDMQSGVVQQFNVGMSAIRRPNLSYYIGSRYLRRVENGLGEKGSNAFTFAATYVLDPRYSAVFSQQYDFDYGVNVRSELTLIRRYHRVNFALTYSVDESMDEHSVIFSIWPEGVPELAFGPGRNTRLGDSVGY